MTTTAHTISSGDLAGILARASGYRLSASPLHALCVVHAAAPGGLSMSAVAKAIDTTTSAVTGTADVLERLGLIERQPAAFDRRVIWLRVTPKGEDALEQILTPE